MVKPDKEVTSLILGKQSEHGIDAAIRSSSTFDSFLAFMQEAGYEIKRGKYISFRATGQERFTRAKTVGDNYIEERIRERIAEPKRMFTPRLGKPSIEKIIDGSNPKILSSPGYRRWATLHNLHVMADTHNYLARNHDLSLPDFERSYHVTATAVLNRRW